MLVEVRHGPRELGGFPMKIIKRLSDPLKEDSSGADALESSPEILIRRGLGCPAYRTHRVIFELMRQRSRICDVIDSHELQIAIR